MEERLPWPLRAMSITCKQILDSAFRRAGITQLPGTGPGTDMYAEAILELNRLMGSLSLTGQYIYTAAVTDYSWASGVGSKTFGPTGDEVLSAEPLYIDNCVWVLPGTSGSGEVVIQMTPVRTAKEWQQISMPNLETDYPQFFWPQQGQVGTDAAKPENTKVHIWTVPLTASTLRMETRTALKSNFTATSDIAYFPQGYDRAIILNFAVELDTIYSGMFQKSNLKPGTRKAASEALRAVLASHIVSPQRVSDADNINSDSPTTVDNLAQRIAFYSGNQA